MGEFGSNLTEDENSSPDNALLRTNDGQKSTASRVQQSLWKDVDPDQSNLPLVAYCFMTGFIDSITYTAVSVWCGFQTVRLLFKRYTTIMSYVMIGVMRQGNTIELALTLARYFSVSDDIAPGTRTVNHSMVSITCFLAGAFLGRIGDRIGPRTRGWLFFGTMIQAVCAFLAAVLLWKGSQADASFPNRSVWNSPVGYGAMAFASASMGLQGIMGKRINTQFATTIVLTTVWCELMADPRLFHPRLVWTRDLKVIAIGVLFLGGFLGRLLLDRIGSPPTFMIGGALRVLIALLWLKVPCEGNIVLV